MALFAAAGAGCTWIPTRPLQVYRSLVDHPYPSEPVGTPAFEAALDRYTGRAAHPGCAARLLQNGDEAYPAMLALIRSARTRISMEMYIVERDRTTDVFFAALADAAARGVEVRFLVDAAGYRRGVIARLDELTARGVHARVFNPMLLSWTVLRINNRDHRKILVVDGEHAVLGGLNLADDQLGDGVTGWRDTALWVSGPVAADAEAVFAETWNQAGRGYFGRDWPVVGVNPVKRAVDEPVVLLAEAAGRARFVPPASTPPPAPLAALPPPPAAVAADGPALPDAPAPPPPWPDPGAYDYDTRTAVARVVASKPDGWNCPTYDLAILGLYGARERVDIACAYFVPPLSLERALLRAARRGVRVRLLVPKVTDVKFVRELGVRYYGKLMAAGVEVYEWPHAILHAKTMAVDGRWIMVGSANMDSRSYFLNYEAMLAVTDEALAARAHADFEDDLKAAQRVMPEAWRARGFRQRAFEIYMRPLAGQY